MTFTEELQRKCVGHVRLPLSSNPTIAEEDIKMDTEAEGGDEIKQESSEVVAEESDERRDTGMASDRPSGRENEKTRGGIKGGGRQNPDERWEEYLDGKLSMILGEADLVDCGGRDLEE